MTDIDWERLQAAARKVTRRAYAPYSGYQVGAVALVNDSRIMAGCNIKNASYGVGLCTECGLVSQLNATGGGRLVAFACCSKLGERIMFCGRCRQLLLESSGNELLMDIPVRVLPMPEALPQAFGPTDLDHAR